MAEIGVVAQSNSIAIAGSSGSSSAMLSSVRVRWGAMPGPQRRTLLLCVASLLALSAISVWWSTRTDWRVLYNGMDGRDAASLQQQLASAGIPYQTTPDGTSLQVPAEHLDKARVAISATGLPQSGRLGFELFDKPNWVGSEFDERVNFQRALEGELEHTIESLVEVRSARVHIVLPKQGAFASEDRPAKASAVLKLRRSNLPREQSDAIRNLIAGAVEGLSPDGVTLVDADGRANFSAASTSGEEREQELALQNKLIAVLEPLAGAGNVHATVSLNFQQVAEEHTDEVYDPQSAIPVTTQKTEQTSQATKQGAVAGASANAPVAQATANNAAPNALPAAVPASASTGSSTGQTQTSKEENSSYAVTRHLSHTAETPGRIRRLTAAIVVNDRVTEQAAGKTAHTVWTHRSQEEMKQLQQLAQAAVGFDDKRGDQVVLENVAFSGNNDIPVQSGVSRMVEQGAALLRSQPTLPRAIATGLVVLLVGMLVLRPLTKQTQQLLAAPLAISMLPPQTSSTSERQEQLAEGGAGAPMSTQHIFDRVTSQIKAEPTNSTRLMGSWIGSTENS